MKSVYIHIPFCATICSYCDFCKMFYNQNQVSLYLKELEKEIRKNYCNDEIKTIYIGGGTPSCLDIKELEYLFNIVKIFKLSNDYEFTFECNIESLTEEKLKFLFENKVNRLSIGIQTFDEKNLMFLNRNHKKKDVTLLIKKAKEIGFNNINIDLMYAFPTETLKELKKDIKQFLKLNISHISTYSLIIEPHTKLYIDKVQNIDQDLDRSMYDLIIKTLEKNNYNHYEISNFSKDGYESKHNLTYWNNLEYYGFGLGASGYIESIRYTNTKALNEYLKGNYIKEKEYISEDLKLEYEFILGLRKINGINKKKFKDKYNKDIDSFETIKKLLESNKLIDDGENIKINPEYIYISNEILLEFV